MSFPKLANNFFLNCCSHLAFEGREKVVKMAKAAADLYTIKQW